MKVNPIRNVMSCYLEVLDCLRKTTISELNALGIQDLDQEYEENFKPSDGFVEKITARQQDFETLKKRTVNNLMALQCDVSTISHIADLMNDIFPENMLRTHDFVKAAIRFISLTKCLQIYVSMQGIKGH